MEFITGMLLATTLFLLYDKYKKPVKNQQLEVDQKQKELDEQELAKHFNELMNYTPEKAYRKA